MIYLFGFAALGTMVFLPWLLTSGVVWDQWKEYHDWSLTLPSVIGLVFFLLLIGSELCLVLRG